MRQDLYRKKTREEAIERTLALLREKRRPILIGEAALAMGALWTLEDAEALLEFLASEGRLRKLPESKFELV